MTDCRDWARRSGFQSTRLGLIAEHPEHTERRKEAVEILRVIGTAVDDTTMDRIREAIRQELHGRPIAAVASAAVEEVRDITAKTEEA